MPSSTLTPIVARLYGSCRASRPASPACTAFTVFSFSDPAHMGGFERYRIAMFDRLRLTVVDPGDQQYNVRVSVIIEQLEILCRHFERLDLIPQLDLVNIVNLASASDKILLHDLYRGDRRAHMLRQLLY